MTYWIITDTHFGHEKITDYAGRPLNFEHKILQGLSVVRPKDVLIHLGDFCFGSDAVWHDRFTSQLPPNTLTWLLRGNHDKKSYSWYLDHGWDMAAEQMLLNIYGKRILFSHHPQPAGNYDINIHGHLHNSDHHNGEFPLGPHNRCVAIEHNYSPVSLLQISGVNTSAQS